MTTTAQRATLPQAVTDDERAAFIAAQLEKLVQPNDLTQNREPISYRSTPGHGYYSFPHDINQAVPTKWRESSYEEDCAWSKAVFCSLARFATTTQQHAIEQAIEYHPDLFTHVTGEKIPFGVSCTQDDDTVGKWLKATRTPVIRAGFGDWCFNVPRGKVYFTAGPLTNDHTRGTEQGYLCPADDYRRGKAYGRSHYRALPDSAEPYERDETFYTWDAYTAQTGRERYF